jgi:hypothetical protein
MAAMFRKTLGYLKSQSGVWFAQHHEVARWLIEQKVEDMSYRSRFFA